MIYLDSSAITKLVVDEPHSAALGTWLTTRATSARVTSEIATLEVRRACRRISSAFVEEAELFLAGLDLVYLDQAIMQRASRLDPVELGSLDALHLASALTVEADLTVFVTYDQQLSRAARAAGLSVSAPK
ncbi:MAG: type II toxin-antitoxin system VapC family toxin [Candidatus Dormibacteraeota bacterium]|nr:type II toxin-antitoxin system VapC family toxin [Candidatus Dormibacteraeota bacterium]MBV9525755.1 type II toxin-antitoxin system VapC family toxin [Candidatus Dormibacteraeota bacterium]